MHVSINQLQINITETPLLSANAEAIVHDTDSALTIPAWLAEAAGESLVREAHFIGWCDIGSAVATSAGKLEVKRVIHVVGPRWGGDSARGKLANATWAILELAEAEQLISLALPPISAGAKGYPIENCAKVMLEQIIDFSFEALQHLRAITCCMPSSNSAQVFQDELQRQIQDLPNAGNEQAWSG